MPHSGTALIDPAKILEKLNLTAGMRVADLGCGRTGHITFQLAPLVGERGVVYALDIMKDVLESIRSQARAGGFANIQTIWSDLENIGAASVPEHSLDAGFLMNVLFMLKKRADALKEAARLIKKDGYLVIVDWVKKIGPLGPSPEQMINPSVLKDVAAKEGFDFIEEVPIGDFHFCNIFKKKSI